jgi:hypothetical protein
VRHEDGETRYHPAVAPGDAGIRRDRVDALLEPALGFVDDPAAFGRGAPARPPDRRRRELDDNLLARRRGGRRGRKGEKQDDPEESANDTKHGSEQSARGIE